VTLIVSVNVGRPKEIFWDDRVVLTSIYKQPVSGPVAVRTLNLDGDEQADLKVHGGRDKAVYAYPSEHYDFWRNELSIDELPWGAFGENLTTSGLLEDGVHIGDRIRIGSAELVVSQPRMPCFKLAARFGRLDMVKRFLRSLRPGFYLRVEREGVVTAGDDIAFASRADPAVAVQEIARMYSADAVDRSQLEVASSLQALPESWREHFRKKLRR
jgi:MOSC domain-containing protein YiiM